MRGLKSFYKKTKSNMQGLSDLEIMVLSAHFVSWSLPSASRAPRYAVYQCICGVKVRVSWGW
jgi:hypothetical protein